jgi:cysteine desulfurase
VPGYFDSATAAPLHPVARAAREAALDDGWADPGRLYGAARRARLLLDAATESVADSIGARPDEVTFAPSGIGAAHAAVLGSLRGHQRAGHDRLFVPSAVEHSAVLNAGRFSGAQVRPVGVDRQGRVDADEFARRAAEATVAALQSANHEVGTTQPVESVAGAIGAVPLVVDASQTLARAAAWSVLWADPRVWGAGPGVGILAVRTGVRWSSPYPDDDRDRLPGPPDLPAIVAAAASLRAARQTAETDGERMRAQIDRLRAGVAGIPDVDVLGDPIGRAPHIVTFSCLYVDGEAVLSELDRRGFAVSSGSSCTSSALEPSHVLVAMGALTSGNVRVSVHPGTTDDEIERFLAVLPGVVAGVRAELGADGL